MLVTSNFTWAQELAKQRLTEVERKEVNGDMPSLPAEVWSIVADILASGNDSSAINRLNVSCSEIHHVTLPTLYETVNFRSLEELEHAIALGTTDRWKYVRYLYLEESISATGLQRETQEDEQIKSIFSRFDGESLFSRLVLLAVVNVAKKPQQLQLTLLRPISLPTLLKICNEWTSGNATDIVSLFGRNFYVTETGKTVPGFKPLSKDITDLIVRPGAYVSRGMVTRDTTHTQRARDISWCAGGVYIEGSADMAGIKQTLALIFDYPGRAGEPLDGSSRNARSMICLFCSSGVLDLVVGAIRECQNSPFFNCLIRLSDLTTREAIDTYILTIDDAYSNHWTHRAIPAGCTEQFFEIESQAPLEEFRLDFSSAFSARLSAGWDDETRSIDGWGRLNRLSGFTASVWEMTGLDRGGRSEMLWARAFPMDSVPIPESLRGMQPEIR